jgi:dihydroneopterin aldolase|tara:strand:- start:9817 stop:10179 length:363 start_codon:yes stop_codon:yes gene_type:complete
MKNTIEVNDIKIYAYHGCLAEEGKIGGNYSVNVSITTDFSLSTQTDDLADTVDYVMINRIVEEEMLIRSKLIEHVGQRIVNRLKKEVSRIVSLKVKVIKHSPPIDGDVANVAIIIEETLV